MTQVKLNNTNRMKLVEDC